jgi:hypothetical protein
VGAAQALVVVVQIGAFCSAACQMPTVAPFSPPACLPAGPFFSWPAVFLSGEQAAAGFALINSLGAVGGFIGPYLLGVLSDRADGGFGTAMLVLAAFLLVSGTLILLFPAPGRREPALGSIGGILKGSELEEAEDGSMINGGSGRSGSSDFRSGSGDLEEEGQEPWLQQPPHRQQPQQQHERLRGGSSSGKLAELECQPILPARGSGHVA